MNKKHFILLFLVVVTYANFINAGKGTGPFIPSDFIPEVSTVSQLLALGAGTVIGVSTATVLIEKCDQNLTNKQKAALKTTGYFIPTASLSYIAYEGVKAALPAIAKGGISGAINSSNYPDILTIVITVFSIVGTIYFADKTHQNAKELYYGKTTKPKN